MYQVDPKLQIGVEYNPKADEVGPLLNYMIQLETVDKPMLNFGLSSDRIGTPPGPMCYYITAAKTFQSRYVPYVSLNYSEHDNGFTIPFGMSIFLTPKWVLLPMNDGKKSHLMLTHRGQTSSVSLLWVWYKHPGISFSWHF